MEQYRDLTLIEWAQDELMVVACDNSASIGQKIHDSLAVAPKVTAALTCRVVLMEMLSIGAEPQALINLVGNEMEPTGRMMIEGLKAELQSAGYPDLPINGSTEENMPTSMTSLGLTLIGRGKKAQLKMKGCQPGDLVYQIGSPLVGQQVIDYPEQIVAYPELTKLWAMGQDIHELVPIGSKGAVDEAEQVASYNQLHFVQSSFDPQFLRSSGPATSILVIAHPAISQALLTSFSLIKQVGRLA